MLVLRRTRPKTINALVSFFIMAACSVWNIRDGLLGSKTALVLGCVFALWAVLIALALIRRRVPVIVTETGLVVNRIVRSPVQIPWSQMEGAKLPESAAPAIITWRASPSSKLQYSGISQRVLGEEASEALRNAILTARPDLKMLS